MRNPEIARFIGTTYPQLPLARLARAMGADAITVTAPGQVEESVTAALSHRRPTVIEVLIDPDEVPPLQGRVGPEN